MDILNDILTKKLNIDNTTYNLQNGNILLLSDKDNRILDLFKYLTYFKKGGQSYIYKLNNIIVKVWNIPKNVFIDNRRDKLQNFISDLFLANQGNTKNELDNKISIVATKIVSPNNTEFNVRNFVSEALINLWIKKTIEEGICINFVLMHSTIVNNNSMQSYSFLELCDGDLVDFEKIMNRRLTYDDYINILIQILYALYILKSLSIIHYDMHFGNILIKKTNDNTETFKYVIDNREFTVPNLGFIVKICDFGSSQMMINNISITPHEKEMIYGIIRKEFDFTFDLFTVFLSVVDVSNTITYNITSKYPNFYDENIKALNVELIRKFISIDINRVSYNGFHFPLQNISNKIASIPEICEYLYGKIKTDKQYA